MTLNKQKGNMYSWCTHTWNPIRGKCPHQCTYCYMKDFNVGELRLDEKALKDNLGEGRTIFVGSSTDMWAQEVPLEWILRVLNYCWKFPDNQYLFQSKNPYKFLMESSQFPAKSIFGTTMETDQEIPEISKAPEPGLRAAWIALLRPTMISIEPIMDFALDKFLDWLTYIKPKFVSIGADSKGHNLPEPPGGKVKELIQELEKFTEVKIKKNLSRLLR